MKLLFLDESGDVNLNNVDHDYPVFVLGGVIVDESYYNMKIISAVQEFKQKMFGRTDLILHTSDINRNRNGFEQLIGESFRTEFYKELNHLMRSLEYEVLACVIDKKKHVEKYGENAKDPYELSLHVLAERFFFYLNETRSHGRITAEKRDQHQDGLLMDAWENILCKKGTYFVSGAYIFSVIEKELILADKKENIIGLQLADLVVNPIGRNAIGKKTHEDWKIIKSKFRRNKRTGDVRGYGLIKLPKN